MKNRNKIKQLRKEKCTKKIQINSHRARLCIYKSNKFNYVQIIDEITHKVIIGKDDKKISGKNKIDKAKQLGEKIAEAALSKKIHTVVFDRRGYKYIGSVKAISEGAREKGLKF